VPTVIICTLFNSKVAVLDCAISECLGECENTSEYTVRGAYCMIFDSSSGTRNRTIFIDNLL